MADITEIRELAKKLNLWNIARGYIDLNDEKLSNLDYLQMILQKELEIRARQKQIKLRRASKLPNKVFDASNLNKGLELCLASKKYSKRQKINPAPQFPLIPDSGMCEPVALSTKNQQMAMVN